MKLGSPERILEAGAVNDISGPSATVNLGALSIRGPKLVYCTQGSEQVWHHPRHNQSFPILLTRNVEPSAVHILRQSFRSHAQIPGALSCQISCNFHNSKEWMCSLSDAADESEDGKFPDLRKGVGWKGGRNRAVRVLSIYFCNRKFEVLTASKNLTFIFDEKKCDVVRNESCLKGWRLLLALPISSSEIHDSAPAKFYLIVLCSLSHERDKRLLRRIWW